MVLWLLSCPSFWKQNFSYRWYNAVLKQILIRFLSFIYRYWKGFVVDPSQSYYYRWLFVISIAVLYNIIFVIARATFSEMQTEYVALWFTLDYLSDLLYILDMVVSSRTGKYCYHGNRWLACFLWQIKVFNET